MRTSPKVTFGLYNLEINTDSTPAATDIQAFSKIADLKTGNVVDYPIATYEPDYWLLSGEYKFMVEPESAVHVGWISSSMSDAAGDFAVAPVLTVSFVGIHTTDGLVLRFSQATGDYADSILVTYYDLLDNVITSDAYSPDAWEYEIDKDVVDFHKIEITFYSTNNPYRYLRLSGIDYGQLISFTGTAIKSASVAEEINQLSLEVPFNTCELNLYSTESTFSIVNPSGYYARLSERQPLSVYEVVGSVQKFMGRYYLDKWKNTTDTLINFKCVDAIGLLDRIPYNGGLWLYQGILVEYLIDEIMVQAGIPYDIDPDLYGIYVMGWIPICSCREALQQVAFAVGAYLDCSRSNIVKIKKTHIITGTEVSIPIDNTQKGASQSLELRTLVTGVEVLSHNYSAGAESIDLYTGTLAIGIYEIQYSEPAHTVVATGATIIDSNVNRARIQVTVAGAVTLSGLKYIDSQQTYSEYDTSIGTYVIQNVVKVTNATLVNSYNGAAVVARVMDYYQQRYKQSMRLYVPTIETGDVALIDSLQSSQIRSVIEKMKINLSGGFIADVEAVGLVE